MAKKPFGKTVGEYTSLAFMLPVATFLGYTIGYLLDLLKTRKPRSLKVCALLHKPARARVQVPIDYLGFTIEDKFVVGYGLDFAERYRNLPFIGVVERT